MVERDRDQAGRPRNARPRDRLGRPVPYGAAGVERIPDDLELSATDTLARAWELVEAGMPFHAHEVLEARWKTGPADERDLWQGLAQLAVGLTHHLRGNRVGAATLLNRAAGRLAGYRGPVPPGLDMAAVVAWSRRGASSVAAGADPPPMPDGMGQKPVGKVQKPGGKVQKPGGRVQP